MKTIVAFKETAGTMRSVEKLLKKENNHCKYII